MITTHLHMQLTDCSIKGNISEFFIHVMNAGSGLISEDDAEGLDVIGSSFEDFIDRQDLSLRALCFELSSQVIPKL
jgi:hypothetical protein